MDEEQQTLTHSMFVVLFPDWTGQTQPRRVKIDGDTLNLGSVTTDPVERQDRQLGARLAAGGTELSSVGPGRGAPERADDPHR